MQAITFLSTLALALAAAPSFTEAAARVEVAASVRVCQPAAISWSGAEGQVFLSAVIGTDPSVSAAGQLKQFPPQSGASDSLPWTVDVQPGTVLTFIINDGTGVPNYSSQITVSGENTCNAGATFAAEDSTTSAAGGAVSSSAPAATTTAAASNTRSNSVSNSSSASRSATSGAPASSSTNTPGAAGSLRSLSGMAVGAGAALVGAAVALL